MIQVAVECLQCKHSFIDEEKKIDNQPSIKVTIEYHQQRGRLNLSSLYGSYNLDCELQVPSGEIIRFFCPYCNTELRSTRSCERCNAPMILLKLSAGGVAQICSRRGCKRHLIEFEDIETELKSFYQRYFT